MNEHDVRVQIHQILDSHAEMLAAIRSAGHAMQQAFQQHDAALVSAIEANRAAVQLLNRLMDEGLHP
jgi:malonyl CoA-acyl carrier protein transacylase